MSDETSSSISLQTPLTVTRVDPDEFIASDFGLQAVGLEHLAADRTVPVDIFLPVLDSQDDSIQVTRVLAAGQVPSTLQLNTIREGGFGSVYCRIDDAEILLDYLTEQVREFLDDSSVQHRRKARLIQETTHLIVERAFSDARLGRHVDRGQEYVRQVVSYVCGNQIGVQALAETLTTDPSLYHHSVNVFVMMASFCGFLGFDPEIVSVLSLGALFHDIGKRSLPERTLRNPGRLSRDEWRLMYRHPELGFEELRDQPSFPFQALRLVRHHHENMDGSGYPEGLRADELEPELRIIRIIDCYDAITSERLHRRAERPLEAIQIMSRDMKSQLDTDQLKSFVRFLGYAGRG
jgi:putative nucleotidyltransferase with HDIG domain